MSQIAAPCDFDRPAVNVVVFAKQYVAGCEVDDFLRPIEGRAAVERTRDPEKSIGHHPPGIENTAASDRECQELRHLAVPHRLTLIQAAR